MPSAAIFLQTTLGGRFAIQFATNFKAQTPETRALLILKRERLTRDSSPRERALSGWSPIYNRSSNFIAEISEAARSGRLSNRRS